MPKNKKYPIIIKIKTKFECAFALETFTLPTRLWQLQSVQSQVNLFKVLHFYKRTITRWSVHAWQDLVRGKK